MHEPNAVGDRAHFSVRRLGWQPEIVIGIVMRQREGTGQRSAETGDAGSRRAGYVDTRCLHEKL